MKSAILGCVFAMLQILPATSAQESKPVAGVDAPKPALQLILSPEHITVTPDENLVLSIRWINLSGKQLWFGPANSSGIDEEYVYDIRASDGKPIRRVVERGASYPYSPDGVGSGVSIDRSLTGLMHAFDMRRPGIYTVQVSVPDQDHPGQMLGTSNKETVTVKTPQ